LAKKEEKLISLKEAAELTGYTPDYIGQLIRKGKIYGKQVYFNVAWMTTPEAVLSYKSGGESTESSGSSWQRLKNRLASDNIVSQGARVALYIVVGFIFVFCLMLFFAFSTSLDRWMNERAVENAQQQMPLPLR
jgi:hypothetical protein